MRSSTGSGFGNYFSVAGRRTTENLFLLNGVEYTGASEGSITPGGVSSQLLGIDADETLIRQVFYEASEFPFIHIFRRFGGTLNNSVNHDDHYNGSGRRVIQIPFIF